MSTRPHTPRRRAALILAAALAALLFTPARQLIRPAAASALAPTPPMGWNSWNAYGCRVDEQKVRAAADAMVWSGMRDAGYQYVVVDDCWQTGRGRDGLIHASTRTFPSGMADLAAYVHARGLKFGVYTDAGRLTCQGRPGSLGYEEQDAATYAAWGVDFVKVDWCFAEGLDPRAQYALWRRALDATGRPIVLSISEWGESAPWDWAPAIGQMWRTSADIRPEWASILANLDQTAWHAGSAGGGRWHDPDMLVVGNPGVSLDESRAQLSLWAIMAAPLIAGNDLPNMSPEVMQLLANREVIAVAQDQAGTPGNIADDTGTGLQVWARPLADGSRAVALLNRTDSPAPITAIWEKVGLPPGSAAARDLWAHADLGTFAGSMTATVPAHGVVMLRVASASPAGWLSERAPSALSNGYGPAELDQSNGEAGQGDGRRISVGGRQFLRGVGAHAPFESTYDLGGGCQRLTADIGVDDEVGVGSGSVVFQVWADGALRYESPVMRGGEPAARVDVDLSEVQQLRLVVGDAGDGTNYDHADWAGAQLRCGG